MGCGPDPEEIQLLSVGKTSVIFPKDFGENITDPFFYDNGAQWYYSTRWSWGFFKNGTVDANLNTCDYGVFNDTEYRLCWHVEFEGTDNGWRCGAIDGDVVDYEEIGMKMLYVPICYGNENGSTCDDNNLCTKNDTCIDGDCQGTPIVCPCESSVCDRETGQCSECPPIAAPTATPTNGGPTGAPTSKTSDSIQNVINLAVVFVSLIIVIQ